MGLFTNWLREKLNPIQSDIRNSDPGNGGNTNKEPITIANAYRDIEIVNRAVNLIVDSASEVTLDVKKKLSSEVSYGSGIKQSTLQRRLKYRPNIDMDSSTFWRLVYLDMVMEGRAFIYYEANGNSFYHIPAALVTVVLDDKRYINRFEVGTKTYSPSEMIYIKDNAYYGTSVVSTGFSRISSCLDSIKRLNTLKKFKDNFYKNGAVLGLVIETDQLLGKKLKQRYEDETSIRYNPTTGKSNVLVLDGGFKAKTIANTSFKDLGTIEETKAIEKEISLGLGVPHILLDGGNNANIRPNVELLFSFTVMPMVKKVISALEFFFDYDIKEDISEVMALRPDLDKQASWITSLVNNGLITGNEGRAELRRTPIEDVQMDTIRIPQNVAGSATGVSGEGGGRPTNEEDS